MNSIYDPLTGETITRYEDRQRKAWWAVHDDDVRKVVGYSCVPNNPESWWCPEIGYSLHEKHHLFESEVGAIDKLITDLQKRISVAQDNIEALRLRKSHATPKTTPA